MTRRRPSIEPRKPVFLGCEGKSEVAYGQLLNDMLRSLALPIHLQVEALTPGVGDPLARVERAMRRIALREKQRARFLLKAILLDSDQLKRDPGRAEKAKHIASQNNIWLIWQDPCHEAFLLRHFPSCASRRPPTAALSLRALEKVWPEYKKPMSRLSLAQKINTDGILQAATVEPGLRHLLENLGILH